MAAYYSYGLSPQDAQVQGDLNDLQRWAMDPSADVHALSCGCHPSYSGPCHSMLSLHWQEPDSILTLISRWLFDLLYWTVSLPHRLLHGETLAWDVTSNGPSRRL